MNTSTAHPSDQILQAYGLGKLDESASGSIHAHLEDCPDCRNRVEKLSPDSFLHGLQDAGARPPKVEVSLTDGLSMLDAGAAMPPAASTMPPGLADHPDYEILCELGRGGMGVVYKAHNKLMGRLEVLKVVGGHLVRKPAVLERFLREIRSAARLHHPNIVTAYSAMRLGESLVLAMEYVDGRDLSWIVKARGPMPVANACSYVHQAALGLQHAHEHGMVHRDIKPANLMLARSGNRAIVKVLDFGLAKLTSEGQNDGALTREGQMLGTPDYIAPEQIRNAQSADIRADIYSLGITLYYLLNGAPPFTGPNLWDVYQAHFSMEASPLNLARPDVPVELAALVAKMMAKDPDRRFQEPKEVAEALKPFFKPAGSQPSASATGRPGTASSPTPTASPATVSPPAAVPAAAPSGRGKAKTGAEGVAWEQLIEIKEDEPLLKAVQPQPAAAPAPPVAGLGGRPPWLRKAVLAASIFGGLMLLGIIIYVTTNKGRIKIVVQGQGSAPVISIDGDQVRIEDLDEPISLRAGDHELTVQRGGMVVQTTKFTVERGKIKEVLVVEYQPKANDQAGTSGTGDGGSSASANSGARDEPASATDFRSDPDKGPSAPPGTKDMPWRMADGFLGQTLPIPGPGRRATYFCMSPDGRRISQGVVEAEPVGANPPSLSLRFIDATRPDHVVKSQKNDIYLSMACFSPNGKALAVSGAFPFIRVWDPDSGRKIRQLERSGSGDYFSVAYSPDGRLIAGGTWTSSVDVWNADTGELQRSFNELDRMSSSLAFR